MSEKKNRGAFVLYLLVVIIGSALAGYVGIRLSEAGTFRPKTEAQAGSKGTENRSGGPKGTNGPDGTNGADVVEATAFGSKEPEGGVLETPGVLEGEEVQITAGLFADPDPCLVYPPSYNMSVSGFDGLPFPKEALIKALGDFGYENNLTITRADYAGALTGNGKNAVSFGIQANADTDIYITATYYENYERFLFIFDNRTAAVAPSGPNADSAGNAVSANRYKADDLVIYDIPTDVYSMFQSEEGFRNAVYAYLTAQGIFTDSIVAGEWYEIDGDSAVFTLETPGRTIQVYYDAVRDAYSFS